MSSGEDNTAAQRLLQELESSFLNKSAIDRAREEEQIMQKYGVSVIASTASPFIDVKHWDFWLSLAYVYGTFNAWHDAYMLMWTHLLGLLDY